MVKLTAPCFSMEARGTIAKSVTYVKGKRTAYAKKHFKPANPQTLQQSGIREMTKWLTQRWKTLTTLEQTSFAIPGKTLNLAPYHAYLRINCQRWARHQLPIIDYSFTEGMDSELDIVLITIEGDNLEIYVETTNTPYEVYMLEICMSQESGFTPSRSNLKFILTDPNYVPTHYVFEETRPNPWDGAFHAECRFSYKSGASTPFEQMAII